MSMYAQHQQEIRDAVAQAVEAATAELQQRIADLEAKVLDVVKPTAAPSRASRGKSSGTTAEAAPAAASGSAT